MLVTAVLLARRWIDAEPRQRRVLGPVYAYGTLAVVFFPFSAGLLEGAFQLPTATRGLIQFAVLGGIPIAFALGVLLGGFARTGEIEELGTWLGVSGAGRPDVAAALSVTLGDPSLRVSYWVPERKAYVDADGRTAQGGPGVPQPSGRNWIGNDVRGTPVGAITYDSSLIGDPDLVPMAGRVVAIAVDRERLTAELRASHAALQRSRERLVNAIGSERRRIAQDLHDGIQMRLVLLALEAQQIGNARGAGAETTIRATALRHEIDGAAADLRQLVHNVMPAGLVERGLWTAVEDLTDRMPIPTRLDMAPKRRPGTLPPRGSRAPPTSWSPRPSRTRSSTPARARRTCVWQLMEMCCGSRFTTTAWAPPPRMTAQGSVASRTGSTSSPGGSSSRANPAAGPI